jgi:hypothetical protein
MSGSQYSDLADRVEDAVRAYILSKMPPDASGELAAKPFRELLHIYGNWRGRHPFARPRTVHRSRELLASAEVQTFSAEIAELVVVPGDVANAGDGWPVGEGAVGASLVVVV